MVFSSLEFLFLYFAAVLFLYFITPHKFRNITLFLVSLIFYGWGEPRYVVLMFLTIYMGYLFRPRSQIYRIGIVEENVFSKRAIVAAVLVEVYLVSSFLLLGSNLVGIASKS